MHLCNLKINVLNNSTVDVTYFIVRSVLLEMTVSSMVENIGEGLYYYRDLLSII